MYLDKFLKEYESQNVGGKDRKEFLRRLKLAKEKLDHSAVPETVSCRDNEKEEIATFLDAYFESREIQIPIPFE